jgi:phage baseplate assembly protein W
MAINIKNLSNKTNGKTFSFSDIHLDFQEKQVSSNSKNSDIIAGNDILIDTDEQAIINSITNILLQKRYLNTNFNVNLKKYIGKPISDMTGMALGGDIEQAIKLFEPRVKIQKITIFPNTDQNYYKIYLSVIMPNFSQVPINLMGMFESNGNLKFEK